jgi:hypothetical protein
MKKLKGLSQEKHEFFKFLLFLLEVNLFLDSLPEVHR